MGQWHRLLRRGLARTAEQWPAIRPACGWLPQAATLLAHATAADVCAVRRAYRGRLATMRHGPAALGDLASAITQVRTVTKSYWPGLFRCYEVPALPRTNNDLEHCFGAVRHHEWRATGRKGASPVLVVRGGVRVAAALGTPLDPFQGTDLPPRDRPRWQQLRAELAVRQETRRHQLRFRRDPDRYLRALEDQLLKPSLPS